MENVAGKNIWVGLSGGVDSAVSALLLRDAGASLTSIYLKCWEDILPDGSCPWEQDQKDAEAVAQKLGIPFRSINLVEPYRRRVFQYMLDEYEAGRTPNPDVVCNREIKFGLFLEEALANGADAIATGHYVRRDGEQLLMGADNNKDQSYFLWQLTPRMTRHALFPIGEMEKPLVRRMAAEEGFAVADKPDSVGICFVGEVPMQEFLEHYIAPTPGPVLTSGGVQVGEHRGLAYYTIGQRKGIGVYGGGPPYFVAEKDKERNALIVVAPSEEAKLYEDSCMADEVNWISGEAPFVVEQGISLPMKVAVRVRYRQALQGATLEEREDGRVHVAFDEPQRAVTPGQSVVFYQGEVMLGGGVIV